MEKLIYVWVLGKATEFAKKGIYRSEIINAGKAGIEKFETVVNNFWDKAEEYIMKEKEVDRKWIPNTVEKFGEEAIHNIVKVLREELEPKKLIQEIFDIEKTENPNIF